jgi:hypothetical protein
MAATVLGSWNEGAAKRSVVEFVERTVADDVAADERVAVFDNDGTLWCEKPMPIQADFILRRLAEMAQSDPGLRDPQPWKAGYDRGYDWLATVLAEHYAGNDAKVGTLLTGVLAAMTGSAWRHSRRRQTPSCAPRSIRPFGARISSVRTCR